MYPYRLPSPDNPVFPKEKVPEIEPQGRGGCLTIWLGVSLAATLINVVQIIQLMDLLRPGALRTVDAQRYALLVICCGTVLTAGGFVSLYGIWSWKRWGVYGIIAVGFLSPFFAIVIDQFRPIQCIPPFTQSMILYFLVRNRWHYFR